MSYLQMRPVEPVERSEISDEETRVNLDLLQPPANLEMEPPQNSPRVWIEHVRMRRPMNQAELSENSDLFEALEALERRHIRDLVVLTVAFLIFYVMFVSLLLIGVVPFCNQ